MDSSVPDILWVNRDKDILVRVIVPRATEVECIFDAQRLSFTCRSKDFPGRQFSFAHELFEEIFSPKCVFNVLSGCVDIKMHKLMDDIEWPRFTRAALKTPKIRVDWDRADIVEDDDAHAKSKKLAETKAKFEMMKENYEAMEHFEKNMPDFLRDVKKIYLTVFNATMSVFWTVSLIIMLNLWSQHDWNFTSFSAEVWAKCGQWPIVLQLFSTVEIIHNVIGLVPGNALAALGLHAGRDMVLFAAIASVPQVQQSPFVAVILLGWCSTEMVRYLFYALNVYDICPFVVKWMRYTYPVLVFPVVSFVEVYVEYLALPHIAREGILSSPPMPNWFNLEFRFEHILVVAMIVHALCTPLFFANLWRLRTNALTNKKAKRA